MHQLPALPVHPTKRHPLTGQPLQALYVSPKNGRIYWPIIGAAEDDGAAAAAAEEAARAAAAAGGTGTSNAVDDKGNDLGYPKNTPVAEMKPEQASNYWRHQSQKHEGRYKNLTGDRSFDDIKKDLDEIAEIRKSQQTPAEQQINDAREQGKAEALAEASNKAATAIFRASLVAQGHTADDINDLVENFNVTNFVTDGDVDIDKLSTFVKRFTPAGKAKERRDFGGGNRPEGSPSRGAAGKAEAARRFPKTT